MLIVASNEDKSIKKVHHTTKSIKRKSFLGLRKKLKDALVKRTCKNGPQHDWEFLYFSDRNGKTKNTVTVDFYDNQGKKFDSDAKVADTVLTSFDVGNYKDKKDVGFIEISIDGSDAAHIDYAYLRRNSFCHRDWLQVQFGVKRGGFWCLSTDKNDLKGNPNCYRRLRFMHKDWRGYKKGLVYPVY